MARHVRSLRWIAVAVVLLLFSASAQADIIAQYRLHDHPFGNEVPPTYGLRLDNLFGQNNTVTLSFDANNSAMFLDVRNDGPNGLQIDIYGTVYGGIDNNANAWTNPQAFNVSFSYIEGVSASGGGWQVADSANNTGTISYNNGQSIVDIGDDFNNSFYFLPDGDRIPGDNSTFVGRGWLALNGQTASPGSQDWLFTAEIIPAPTSALLGFMGLCLVGVVRRR